MGGRGALQVWVGGYSAGCPQRSLLQATCPTTQQPLGCSQRAVPSRKTSGHRRDGARGRSLTKRCVPHSSPRRIQRDGIWELYSHQGKCPALCAQAVCDTLPGTWIETQLFSEPEGSRATTEPAQGG